MDNRKIGKLIASLRKQQGLTQQELGDKVGVGFRAVSKWERGLTLPDITIINEVSKILGISSDELLAGEINKSKEVKTKKKIPTKLRVVIVLIVLLIVIFLSTFIYYNNKVYIYDIKSNNNNYYVEGQVIFKRNKMSLIINNLHFVEEFFEEKIIKNYEYEISSGDEFIYGFGFSPNGEVFEEKTTIKKFAEQFQINYSDEINSKRTDILDNDINIIINFIDENDNEITREIEISLYLPSDKENK